MIIKKYKTCKRCGSEFVCWNWFKSPFWRTWFRNFFYNNKFPYFRWKFWKFFDRWNSECWDCGGITTSTFFKVRNGISYSELNDKFVYLPRHKIRDACEVFYWILSQARWHDDDEKNQIDKTMNNSFTEIKEAIEEHWKTRKENKDKMII